jgi:pSer/pThr/pTyr-binding forkhead associated (FHA) protein
VNAAKLYVEGKSGVIEMRLVNSGAGPLDRATVEVRSGRVSRYGRHEVKGLAADATSRRLQSELALPPGAAGETLVGFSVTLERAKGIEGDRGRAAYRGEESILVLPPEASPQSFVVNVEGAKIEGERTAMGAYISAPVNLREAVEAGRIRTATDLLRESAAIAPAWRAVDLYLDEVKTDALGRFEAGAKRVPRRSPPGPASTKLRLDIAVGPDARRVIVVSKREVTFGRSRRGSDICLLVLPLTRETTRVSKEISGRFDARTGAGSSHMTLRLAHSGAALLDQSRNGTFVGGERLSPDAPTTLARLSKVSLAEVLDLEARVLSPGDEFDPAGYVVHARGGMFEDALGSHVAAVSIERVENLPEESYLVIYAGACIGSSREAAVALPGSGLAPRHLLVLHLGDGFYVENVSGRADGARLNGTMLAPDTIEPIRPGDRIESGTVTIEVGEFEQLRPEG